MEEKIASGVIFKADTIEELAQQFGADPQALAETVAKHNESCKTLEDEFGRVIYSEEDLIVTPPFYASASAPTAHHSTMPQNMLSRKIFRHRSSWHMA